MASSHEITVPQSLALAYAPAVARPVWEAALALDSHLATLIAKASEPMLAQIRLAWWRDRLSEPRDKWPKGNPILSALSQHWPDGAGTLAPLVDGWEYATVEPPMSADAVAGYAAGRASMFGAVANALHGDAPASGGEQSSIETAGRRWALADLAAHVADAGERDTILAVAEPLGLTPAKLPRTMRPLAVLDGLARRALTKGGGPLFAGRRAALALLRLGMFGR